VPTEINDKPGLNVVVMNDDTLVCLYGRIDMDSSPAVRERLRAVLKDLHNKRVRLDLSAVTHMDSSGIATLIEALKLARGQGDELRLQGLQNPLLRVFEFSGILSLFNGSAKL
jgi:anti-sigma B factor antagonist